MLVAFLFSIFFAYLVDPVVCYTQRWFKGSRGKAIAAVYVAFLLVLVILGFLVGPRLAAEGEHLAQSLPDMFQKLSSGQIAWSLGRQHGWSYETQLRIQHFLAEHQNELSNWAKQFATRLVTLVRSSWWLVLIPILGVFFLKDGAKFAEGALDLLERRRQRAFLDAVLRDINVMLAHFIRAQLVLAVLSSIVYTIGLLAMRLPYAVALGAIGGALEFIPVVGPLTAFLLIVFVALVTGYKHLLLVILFLGIWRGVQDYVTAPRIMGRQTELHPLAALFGVLVGAEVGGVIGVYLSIPIMASVRIVWRHWRTYMERSQPTIVPPGVSPPAGLSA